MIPDSIALLSLEYTKPTNIIKWPFTEGIVQKWGRKELES